MAPMEILALFASHARGDMGDFWSDPNDPDDPDEVPRPSLRKARELGLTHLIKKIKVGKDGSAEIELYDAQAAGRELAKISGLHRRDDSAITVTVQHVLRAMPAEVRERVLASVSARMGQALAAGNEEEPPIDVEVTEAETEEITDAATALVPWNYSAEVHGLGDDEETTDDV